MYCMTRLMPYDVTSISSQFIEQRRILDIAWRTANPLVTSSFYFS